MGFDADQTVLRRTAVQIHMLDKTASKRPVVAASDTKPPSSFRMRRWLGDRGNLWGLAIAIVGSSALALLAVVLLNDTADPRTPETVKAAISASKRDDHAGVIYVRSH